MGLLDKILFVADYIEPNRCEAPRLGEIRKLAFSDLDRTVAEILYFIMGGDSLDYFETWMRPDIIAKTAIILVMVRENFLSP